MLTEKTIKVIDTNKAKKNDFIIFSHPRPDGSDGPKISGIVESIEEKKINVTTTSHDTVISVKDLIDDNIRIIKIIPAEFKSREIFISEKESDLALEFEELKKEVMKKLSDVEEELCAFYYENDKTSNSGVEPGPKTYKLWARVGVSIDLREDQIAKFMENQQRFVRLSLENGSAYLDGETYFPEEIEDNAEFEKENGELGWGL